MTLILMRTELALLAILAATSSAAFAQWTLETSNTTADLRGIHSIGGGVAWASGTNGTVLRTEDGGYVWQSCSVPPGAEKLDFRGIQAFDAKYGDCDVERPGRLIAALQDYGRMPFVEARLHQPIRTGWIL
jgi:photosystem II stability/assembly factor-like uncharacterized protein